MKYTKDTKRGQMPEMNTESKDAKPCEWCAALQAGHFGIPFKLGKFCTEHARVWLVAAEAALGYQTRALTRAKMHTVLGRCQDEAERVAGVLAVKGPGGARAVVSVGGGVTVHGRDLTTKG